MGYNSCILVLNDALNEIKEDKDFGEKVYHAVLKLSVLKEKIVDIPSGIFINAASAISSEHADVTQIISIGGNMGQTIANLYYTPSNNKIKILKQLADQHGYEIRKKKRS